MWPLIIPLFLFFEIIGFIFYGAPLGPDSIDSWRVIFGAFALFLTFLISLMSWGLLIARQLNQQKSETILAFGALFYCFLAAALGHLGLIHYSQQKIAILILFLGPLLLTLSEWRNSNSNSGNLDLPRLKPQWTLCFIAFMICAPLSFTFDSMADPLWYHLVGPRLFTDSGKIYLPPEFPIALKSGLWEYLFIWGNMILGGPEGSGLIAGQTFGQWTHMFIGLTGSYFLLQKIFAYLFPKEGAAFICVLTLYAIFSTELMNVSHLAKNDWGAVLFALAGLLFALEKKYFWAGVFYGAAFTSKYTVAFSFLGFLFLVPKQFYSPRNILKFLFSFGLGISPICLRNLFLTGNPLFPTMNSFFHSPLLGPSWRGIEAFSGHGLDWSASRIIQVETIFNQSFLMVPALIFCLLLPFIEWIKKNWRIAAAGFFPVVVFFTFAGTKAEVRLLGPTIFFVIAFGGINLKELLTRFTPKTIASNLFFTALAVLPICPLLAKPLSFWNQIVQQDAPSLEIRKHPGGAASAWMRMNLPFQTKIASGSETRLYYLTPMAVTRIWDDPLIDRKLREQFDVKGLFQVLDEAGIQYLLITNSLWDTYYDRQRWDLIAAATLKFPQALSFSTETSRVLDIKKMRTLVDTLEIKK